jgi:hypothetical protein
MYELYGNIIVAGLNRKCTSFKRLTQSVDLSEISCVKFVFRFPDPLPIDTHCVIRSYNKESIQSPNNILNC